MSMFGTSNLVILSSNVQLAEIHPHSSGTAGCIFHDEAVSLAVFQEGCEVQEGRSLKSILLVELRTSRSGVVATTYLQAEEYGWGMTEIDAVEDLLLSLIEYKESLESRRANLADPALEDLKKLCELFE